MMNILPYIALAALSGYSVFIGCMIGREWSDKDWQSRAFSIGLITSMMLGVVSLGFLIR